MGCCAGRPKGAEAKGTEPSNPGGPVLTKRYSQYYHTKTVFNKSEDQIKKNQLQNKEDPDFAELTLARENQDMKKIFEFIPSTKPIKEKLDLSHPWAASPETIGSVSLMFLTLSIIPTTDESSSEEEKRVERERIGKHIELLMTLDVGRKIAENLRSTSADRYELSVLLAMFMMENSHQSQDYLLEKGIMPMLVNYMDKNYKKGLKLAAFQSCSYLYKGRPEVCKTFCERQGLQHIAEFLKDPDDFLVNEALTALDELTLLDVKTKRRNEEIMKLIEERHLIPIIENYMDKNKANTDVTNQEIKDLRETNLQYISYLKSVWSSVSNSDPKTLQEDPAGNNHNTDGNGNFLHENPPSYND